MCNLTNCGGEYRFVEDLEGLEHWECGRCGHVRHVRVFTFDAPAAPVAVWDLVIADMRARDALGADRYGTRLHPNNGRDALQDAYEEALDLAVYLKQAIVERSR